MKTLSSRVLQALGILLSGLGMLCAFGWLLGADLVHTLTPGAAPASINAAILLLASGACLLDSGRHLAVSALAKAQSLCAAILTILPLLVLAQYLFDINFHIDFPSLHASAQSPNPHPGRVAPNAALAFLLAGLFFLLRRMRIAQRVRFWVANALAMIVFSLGLAGLLGYLLNLQMMYQIASLNQMTIPATFGICLLGIGMLIRTHARHAGASAIWRHEDRRITRIAGAILAVVVIAAGLSGFALVRQGFENAMSEKLQSNAEITAAVISSTLEQALLLSRSIATRPELSGHFFKLSGDTYAPAALAAVDAIGKSFLPLGFSGILFFDAHGDLVMSHGIMAFNQASVSVQLGFGDSDAVLFWQNGFVLRNANTVHDQANLVGTVVTEQRLSTLTSLVQEIARRGATNDGLLCGREGNEAVCFPGRFTPANTRLPILLSKGSANHPIAQALLAQSGVTMMVGERQQAVLAGYAPIANQDMGLMIKADVAELFAPIRVRLQILVGLLVLLVIIGVVVLRLQVQPLAARILAEQRRMQVILENSNDAFVAIDHDGFITDWNMQAQKIFGWTPQEALGRSLPQLIFPAERYDLNALAKLLAVDDHEVVNHCIELTALHQSGRLIPIELALASFHDGEGVVSNAFIRDISQRKAFEKELIDGRQRLRTITDNLPVLIAYIDEQQRFQFCNGTFQEWMNIAPEQMIGRHYSEVVDSALYEERRESIERALQGERVEFEIESTVAGITRHLHTIYVPDIEADGKVAGLYALTMDVSAQKAVEHQLAQLARFDDLTGLPNRRQLDEKLAEAMSRSKRLGAPMALLFLDLDRFKTINDSLGHPVGDHVLREFSRRLRASVRDTDSVFRLAGDEFVIILEGLHYAEEAQLVARKIIATVNQPFDVNGNALQMQTSIGIAFFMGGEMAPAELVAHADRLLYQAKDDGRNTYKIGIFEGLAGALAVAG